MNLMQENAENKERMVLSVICGVITVIAVCALVMLASYLALPVWVRVALLVLVCQRGKGSAKPAEPGQGR